MSPIAHGTFADTAMMSNPSPEVRAKIPIGRLGKPDEIASIVLMLVQNGYMTNKVHIIFPSTIQASGAHSSCSKVICADGGWTGGGL